MQRLKVDYKTILLLLGVIVVAVSARYAMRHFYRAAYPIQYSAFVQRYSAENNLPPSLVYAVIRTESGFDPAAFSSAGAKGLMQITEDTFHWIAFRKNETEQLTFDALLDEETNIRYGAALLRLHLEEFGTVKNALCAYHAGRGSLMNWLQNPELSVDGKHIDQIPFGGTRHYVSKVIEAQILYQTLYNMN